MILRARTIVPVTAPPIENGAVLISANRIRGVGTWNDLKSRPHSKVVDLGDSIVLPGLVNAHCHLDYTDMGGQLSPPKTFTEWIPKIIAGKAAWSYSEFAHSWLHGAHMLLRTGTTTVADIEMIPDLLQEAWDSTPLRVFSFLEMTGIRARRSPKDIVNEAVGTIDSLSHSRCRAFLSPHAPYSTVPELLRLTAEVSRKRKWRVATHIAESVDEFEMFMHARGPMFRWMQKNERNNADCGIGSPVEHYARHRLLNENVLAIHVNVLARGDAALLGRRRVNVVHCPRSHDYFKHPRFLRDRLANAGANICLGTDSLATMRKVGRHKLELNMFEEMQMLLDNDETVSAAEIVRMATVNGARALGMTGEIGEIAESTFADIIAIPTDKNFDPYETIVSHTGPVSASMIDGRWAVPPG